MNESRYIILRNQPATELAGIPHRVIEVEKSWLQGRWRRRIWFFEYDVTDDEIVAWATEEFKPADVAWQLDLPF